MKVIRIKYLDTQVITGIIGDKFHFYIEARKVLYMKKEENRQERRYQSYNRYRRKQNLSKSQK